MKHRFKETKFNRRYCFTCNQEQRKDRSEWVDFGPMFVSVGACSSEKKQLLKLTYPGQGDPQTTFTKEETKMTTYQKLREAFDDTERAILNKIYCARDLYNSIIKDSGVQYDTDNDLLHCDEIWIVDISGVTCKWADGVYGRTSFYSADMLGTEWKYFTTKKADEFITEQRRIKAVRESREEEKDLATFARLQKKFNG